MEIRRSWRLIAVFAETATCELPPNPPDPSVLPIFLCGLPDDAGQLEVTQPLKTVDQIEQGAARETARYRPGGAAAKGALALFPTPSIRTSARFALLVLTGASSAACSDDGGSDDLGATSEGAVTCTSNAECGGSSECACGVCTARCTSDAECAAFDDPHCAIGTTPAVWSQCGSFEPDVTGLCFPSCTPGSCASGQMCIDGSCTALPYPASPFCAATQSSEPAGQALEEALLEAIQSMRRAGGILCGPYAPTTSVEPLRVDARLTCAARVLAADLLQSGAAVLEDSQGRDSRDRLTLAEYTPATWGESFSRGGGTAQDALAMMLLSPDSCLQLNNPDLVDIGIGSAGDVVVVTLATPR